MVSFSSKVGNAVASPVPSATVSKNEANVQKAVEAFGVSEEVWDVYQATRKAYAEETGVDFGSSTVLNTTSITLFAFAGDAASQSVAGLVYKPLLGSANFPLSVPERKSIHIADYLQERLEDIGSRDEAWVRQVYSFLKDTPEDQKFVSKMVEDYRHMTELTKRLITALTFVSDQASKEKPSSSHDLFNVLV